MKGWDLFKVLARETGFYKMKFLIFVIIAILGLSANYLWHKSRPTEAATQTLPSQESSQTTNYANSSTKMDITITQDAQVIIDGNKDNNVLKFYENFDEVKIIVFNSPGAFIQKFEGTIHLPSANAQSVKQIIYAVHGVGTYDSSVLDAQTLYYEVNSISPQAIVTIVADLPKGMVTPSFRQNVGIKIAELPLKIWLYVGIILPIITIILMAYMLIKRRYANVIFAGKSLIMPPASDPPAVVGVLINGTVGAREIAATLIDLARRKFILIVNKGNGEFSFGQLRGSNYAKIEGLQDFEKVLLGKIFLPKAYKSTLNDVEMRIGRHIFSRKIAQFYLGVYNYATKKGYFVKNPAKVHLAYKYTGLILLFLSLVGFAIGAITAADPKFGLLFWVGGMVAAFFVVKFSPYMPARSNAGTEELKKWLAFRKYLVKSRELTAEEVIQSKFEEYLAITIVLGVEVEWANMFMDVPFAKPDWYESAERAVTLESFIGEFFPFLGYVADNLAKSHEPTIE